MSKKRLTPGTLALVQQWVAKEICNAADQVRYYSESQTLKGEHGKAIFIEPNPEQVALWTQKHAMLEGVANALDELAEKRKAFFELNELSEKILLKTKQ